jgi:hypothetical protein
MAKRQIKSVTKYTIDDSINDRTIDSDQIFIISNECLNKKGKVSRYYTLFPSFKMFLRYRDNYPHCHEILIDHKNNEPNKAGRLAFDFDIPHINGKSIVPKKFKKQVESIIYKVISKYFINVNADIIEFIWMSCPNEKKTSKHLICKNLCFDNWITLSKIFYKYFCKLWDKKYTWMNSALLVDEQIIKKNTSLRMVGSSKIGGNLLECDNDGYLLQDTLIRIYDETVWDSEQIITKDNLKKQIQNNTYDFDDMDLNYKNKSTIRVDASNSTNSTNSKPEYNEIFYNLAYTLIKEKMPYLNKGKISGKFMHLDRTKKGKCIISGKIHENENAYCVLRHHIGRYYIDFGCYRKCTSNDKNLIAIGAIDEKSFKVTSYI